MDEMLFFLNLKEKKEAYSKKLMGLQFLPINKLLNSFVK